MDQRGTPFSIAGRWTSTSSRTVVVTGEVDMATAPLMHEAATGEPAVTSVRLDLRGVTFFDSAAIHALIGITRHFPGTALSVLASPQVRRVLEISGLADQPWLTADDQPEAAQDRPRADDVTEGD